MRDWRESLQPASYKGVSFRVEKESAPDGRRLAKHEFAGRDDPFVEDMGRKIGSFEVVAYVTGDEADFAAAALKGLAGQGGAGPLILPFDAPFQAHLEDVKRSREKDRAGYFAFDLSFVRDGALPDQSSVWSLAQAVYDAADAAVAAFANFAARIEADGPALARDAAQDALGDIPAALETVRAANTVDPAAQSALMGAFADRLSAVTAAVAASGVDGAWFAAAAQDARDLADAMPADAVEGAFAAAADLFPPLAVGGVFSGPTAALSAAANQAEAARFARAALLVPRVEALPRRGFSDRTAAKAARAAMLRAIDEEAQAASYQGDEDAYAALADLRAALTAWFAAAILDLKPVVTASANRALPATWWAWRLYGDATRADELVARNRASHPHFMPATIEAVAP